tara:strand:- start:3628 stop:5670 length:2043 start_codon:yes stop_codon:yes gene_type:complete
MLEVILNIDLKVMSKTVNVAFAKIAVALVALAMVFSVVAPASAQNVEDMSLEELIALVTQLQAQLGGGDDMSGGSDAAVCPYTWTRSLNMGDTGADVMALQQFLNSMPETQVAPAGSAGGPGSETSYYGPATGAAVSNFQMMYRAEILTPLGLVNPTTFFGNSTRAQANALCVAGGDMDDDMDEDEDEDEDEDMELSGEASVDAIEIDDVADDDIEEGEEDAPVAEVMVEFTDGDAEISRMDVQLLGDGEANTNTVEPWEAFESVSLWVDGDKVAEVNADDEDDYLDEDAGTLRMSGLDIVGMEDEELDLVIAVTVMDGLDANELTDWDISVEAMRFFDADGVATTEEANDFELGDDVTFTVQEAGDDDELDVSSSSADPESTTLILQDDDEEAYVVFAFDLDTDDSTNDVEVEQIIVDGAVASGTPVADLVDGNDVRLLLDGDEVDTDDVTVAGNTITFDFDSGDLVIDAGEEITLEMEVTFDALLPVNEGSEISFSLTGNTTKIQAEGADDLGASQISGAASGETHTLITAGIVVLAEDVETSTDTSGDNDTLGEFTIDFDVTAYDGDFYITDNSAANTGSDGAVFLIEGPATTTATITSTLTSTGDEDTTGVFTVEEGETETFTLRVTADVATSGDYRVTLRKVYYSTNTDGATGAVERALNPVQDYRTDYETIQAN